MLSVRTVRPGFQRALDALKLGKSHWPCSASFMAWINKSLMCYFITVYKYRCIKLQCYKHQKCFFQIMYSDDDKNKDHYYYIFLIIMAYDLRFKMVTKCKHYGLWQGPLKYGPQSFARKGIVEN
jgi:hypothetical protein